MTKEELKVLGFVETADGEWVKIKNRLPKHLEAYMSAGYPIQATPIVFYVRPKPGLRMSSSDRWRTGDKQRPEVRKYFDYCNILKHQAEAEGYKLGDVISIKFCFSVSKSWSKKKKEAMLSQPHQQKPDLDNLIKGVMDALKDEDCSVYRISAAKQWSDEDMIILWND